LLLKAADGALEIVAGALLLIVSPSTIDRIARRLTAHELSEDPHDRIAQFILHTSDHLSSGATLFAAVYLLSHGVSKVVLVAFVLRDNLWAYPWLIALLAVFHRLPALCPDLRQVLMGPDRADRFRRLPRVADVARVPGEASTTSSRARDFTSRANRKNT
jgi:hypothetical protein